MPVCVFFLSQLCRGLVGNLGGGIADNIEGGCVGILGGGATKRKELIVSVQLAYLIASRIPPGQGW